MTLNELMITKGSWTGVTRRYAIFLLTGLISSAPALAELETDKTIDRVGVSGTVAYFTATEGFSVPCTSGAMQVDLGTPAGRALYATVLTAKATNRKLSRIEFSVDLATGACIVTLAEMSG
jgi:predicted ribosomally synthesized peptide with SipW-like signal peptide